MVNWKNSKERRRHIITKRTTQSRQLSPFCWYCCKERILAEIVFDYCQDCIEMAAVPQGAFAACKIKSTKNKKDSMIIARIKNNESQESRTFHNKKLMEYSPVKYNSKLMNAIWGHYNRYSPHNIKGVGDESPFKEIFLQQPILAAYAIAQKVAMENRTGKEWNFPVKPEPKV